MTLEYDDDDYYYNDRHRKIMDVDYSFWSKFGKKERKYNGQERPIQSLLKSY